MSKIVEKFYEDFPLYVDAMKDTCHHGNPYVLKESSGLEVGLNPYHLEGDVWTHTMMVVNQSLNQTGIVPPTAMEVVEYTTLLHDLGKTSTRKRSKTNPNRIHFYGHAGVSAWQSLRVLEEWGVPPHLKRLIMQTISLHHSFMEMLSPFDEKQSLKVGKKFRSEDECMMLFHQMACDALGRIDNTHGTSLESVNEAMRQWQEMGAYHTSGLDDPDQSKPTVTVMVGLPASGKSTYARTLNAPHIISRDDIVMSVGGKKTYADSWEVADQKEVDKHLEAEFVSVRNTGEDFVVDMTNLSPKARRRSLAHIGDKYNKKAVVMATSTVEIYSRNFARKKDGKFIEPEVIHKMMTSYTAPMYDEFDEITYVFPDGEEAR